MARASRTYKKIETANDFTQRRNTQFLLKIGNVKTQ
jgi:hypothetical protein